MYQANSWKAYPFILLLISQILGIVLNRLVDDFYEVAIIIAIAISFGCLAVALVMPTGVRFLTERYNSVWVVLLISGISYFHAHYSSSSTHSDYFTNQEAASYTVKIDLLFKKSGRLSRCYGKVLNTYDSLGIKKDAVGKCLITFKKPPDDLRKGEIIQIFEQPTLIAAPFNPGDFDYKAFLESDNIQHKFYLTNAGFSYTGLCQLNKLESLASRVSAFVSDNIHKQFDQEDAAILQALFLGDKGELDGGIREDFTRTGTIHVLAISGLHMGIIYLMLITLLTPLRNVKILTTSTVILVLWFFAFLTGFSPSVCRSATMFSLFQFGNHFGRRTFALNTLAATCFFMLMFQPMSLWKIGFQFSFMAVGGILIWHRPIRSLISTSSFVLAKIFDLLTVSFCAQLAILPLSVYYFQQIPTHFLLSNLMVVPCVTIIMYSGIGSIFLGNMGIVGILFKWITEAYLWWMKGVVGVMGQWKVFTINQLYPDGGLVIIIYLLLGSASIWYIFKSPKALQLMLTFGIIGSIWHFVAINNQFRKVEFGLYNAGNSYIPLILNGQSSTMFCQSNMDLPLKKKMISNYLGKKRVLNSSWVKWESALRLEIGPNVISLLPPTIHKEAIITLPHADIVYYASENTEVLEILKTSAGIVIYTSNGNLVVVQNRTKSTTVIPVKSGDSTTKYFEIRWLSSAKSKQKRTSEGFN